MIYPSDNFLLHVDITSTIVSLEILIALTVKIVRMGNAYQFSRCYSTPNSLTRDLDNQLPPISPYCVFQRKSDSTLVGRLLFRQKIELSRSQISVLCNAQMAPQ